VASTTKLTKAKAKEILMFMNKYKYLVGMSDWGIVINEDIAINADFKAEVETDIYEQIMKLQVSTSFMNSSINMQRSILIHELIHGRINAYDNKLEKFIDIEQEILANDLERGMMSILKFEEDE